MPAESSRIQAKLATFDTAMVVVSLVVGIGIFRTPAIVARESASAIFFLALWVAGGLVSIVGALIFAELGSRRPRAGGYYKIVADCYDPAVAFGLNWAHALMQGAGAAGVSFIGGEYLAPKSPAPVAFALMVVLLALNFAGIRTGARTQNVLSVAKIVMIVGLAVAALVLAPRAAAPSSSPMGGSALTHILAAFVPVLYAYGGYQVAMNLGADVRDARRRFPIAVTAGMGIVIAIYLLINAAYVSALGVRGIAGTNLVAAALARAAFGPTGATVISAAIFLSAAGFVNATILQMPRAFYAMAEDRILPAAFLRVNNRTQVQTIGLAFFALTMLVPALLLGSFEKLLNYVMLTDSLSLAVAASTIFVLRRRETVRDRSVFRMPGYPLLPGIYILVLLGIVVVVVISQTRLSIIGALVMLTGWPLFILGRRWNRSASTFH